MKDAIESAEKLAAGVVPAHLAKVKRELFAREYEVKEGERESGKKSFLQRMKELKVFDKLRGAKA